MKEKIFKAPEKVKEYKTAVIVSTAGLSTLALSVAASAAPEDPATFSIADHVTTAMLNQVLIQMTDLIPYVLPVVVSCLAFRKGISFLKGQLMGA